MSDFVLDGSVALAWCFPDERTPAVENLRQRLETSQAMVPAHWALEVGNVLVLAERKGRITSEQRSGFAAQLVRLPITIDLETSDRALGAVLELARANQLTTYDAAYLELATRIGMPLATLDRQLRTSCERYGVTLLGM